MEYHPLTTFVRYGSKTDATVCTESSEAVNCSYELRHDKTNKVTVRHAKTQISLGIRPV